MTQNTLEEIKEYLKTVEEEQKILEDKERQLEIKTTPAPAKEEKESKGKEKETAEEKPAVRDRPTETKIFTAEKIDVATELLQKTEDVLRRYSPAFIGQNLEKSKLMLTMLETKSLALPYNTDFEIRGKIGNNVQNFKKLVVDTENTKRKIDEKKLLENFIHKLDKALRRYTKQQISKDPEKAKYVYNILLKEREELPEGNPTFEKIVEKRMVEFEKRIYSISEGEKSKKDFEILHFKINEFLSRSESENFEELIKEYQNLIEHYKRIEDKLEPSMQTHIKSSLYKCKKKIEDLKKFSKKIKFQKNISQERKRKEEYMGIRTFWREYLRDLRHFNDSINIANSSQYFKLYEKYNKFSESFYNLIKKDVLSKEEAINTNQLLEETEQKLEQLRQQI
ncbi:MAG: hypothetical protein ACXQTP_04050 [Candidatus Methanofastidiosia archaeon]